MNQKIKKIVSGNAVRKVMRHVYLDMAGYRGVRTGIVTKTTSKFPDKHCPVVFRVIKSSELAAIPRHQYKVRVLGKVARVKNALGIEGEDELLVAITELNQQARQLVRACQAMREHIMNNGGGGGGDGPSSDNPFKDPINQHEMADSIIKVMHDFFHGEQKCHIGDLDFTNMEFCVIMHIFFKKIHSLKKETRLPFSTFLQNKVFAGKSGFVRTYNKYADMQNFKDFENQLGELKPHYFDRRPIPIPPEELPSDYHKRKMKKMEFAFQEIGYAFQNSPYFTKLKKLRDNLDIFVAQ